MPPLRIALDITVAGLAQVNPLARTGVFTVVENLALALAAHPEVDLSLVCYTPDLAPHAAAWAEPLGLRAALSRPWQPGGDGRAVHFVDGFFGLPEVIYGLPGVVPWQIVYDMLPWLFPDLMADGHGDRFRQQMQALRRQAGILTISEHSKADFCRLMDWPAEAVTVFPLGTASRFRPVAAPSALKAVRMKYGIPLGKPYVLSLATLEPRKNFITVLDAFERLVDGGGADPGITLVVAGSLGWKSETLMERVRRSPRLLPHVAFVGYVADDDLPALYSGAACFVYVPLYEGFGLPPLEAMACGTPVICSNTSSLPEVVGDAGVLLAPDDVAGLAQAVGRFGDGSVSRGEWAAKALARAARFSWTAGAQTLVEAMRQRETG